MENQVVKQESCTTKVTHTVTLKFDFQNLQEKYVDGKLDFGTSILLSDESNTSYEGEVKIKDIGPEQGHVLKAIVLKIYGQRIENLALDHWDLSIFGETEWFNLFQTNTNNTNDGIGFYLKATSIQYQAEQLSSVKGDIRISFSPMSNTILKQNLCNIWNYNKFEEDFKIISAEDIEIGFNRSHLSFISPVFERMLVDGQFLEAENGIMKSEFTEHTIRAFKRIILEKDILDEDKSCEMLLFCDKYDIKPLFKICHDHIMNNIEQEKIDLIVDSAYKVSESDGYELLKKAAMFVQENLGKFEDDPEIKEFMRIEAWAKMMEFIVFQK